MIKIIRIIKNKTKTKYKVRINNNRLNKNNILKN